MQGGFACLSEVLNSNKADFKHQFTLMIQESINAFYKSYNTVLVQIMANKCCNIPQYV